MDRPFIYIASPYTQGQAALNVHFQCRIFDELMNDGVVYPVVPLWSHFQCVVFPRPYEDWLKYDLAFLAKLDGVLRLNATHLDTDRNIDYIQARSQGADRELKRCQELGKPVFFNKQDLYVWVDTVYAVRENE